jgi:hypothetical protein
MSAVDREADDDSRDSVDHLIVSLRAYVTGADESQEGQGGEKTRPATRG